MVDVLVESSSPPIIPSESSLKRMADHCVTVQPQTTSGSIFDRLLIVVNLTLNRWSLKFSTRFLYYILFSLSLEELTITPQQWARLIKYGKFVSHLLDSPSQSSRLLLYFSVTTQQQSRVALWHPGTATATAAATSHSGDQEDDKE